MARSNLVPLTAAKVHLTVPFLLCDMEMQSTSMDSRGQGHLMTLIKGHLH